MLRCDLVANLLSRWIGMLCLLSPLGNHSCLRGGTWSPVRNTNSLWAILRGVEEWRLLWGVWVCGAEPAKGSCWLLDSQASQDHGGSLLLHTCSASRAHRSWERGSVTVSLSRARTSVPPLRNARRNYRVTLAHGLPAGKGAEVSMQLAGLAWWPRWFPSVGF